LSGREEWKSFRVKEEEGLGDRKPCGALRVVVGCGTDARRARMMIRLQMVTGRSFVAPNAQKSVCLKIMPSSGSVVIRTRCSLKR
jgi:hypothetical protein